MEVNTRIQVEHPVTEMITGIDLVAAQLAIAQGERVPITQDEVHCTGAAIECRISAEDPHSGFLPRLGVIDGAREPAGPGIRVDSGLWVGQVVSRHFDPLLSKVIAWAPTRDAAIGRMRRALAEYVISGVDTTIPFHLWALDHPEFAAGRYDVRFADAWGHGPTSEQVTEIAMLAAAAWAYRNLETLTLPVDGAAPAWVAAAREEGVR
jgi:acetyl-CoA carboxylase biotin carboxylase subunit